MSFSGHPAAQALKKSGALSRTPLANAVLDAVEEVPAESTEPIGSAGFVLGDIRIQVASSILEWAGTDDTELDAGEGKADRLFAMLVGIADSNKDGEISEDEQAIIDIALNSAFDYLAGKGVTEEDATALLENGDNDAADRVADMIKGELPDGDEASLDDIDAFAFDAESQASVFDSAVAIFDAAYRKVVAVRGGKKVRINKRVSGTVHLSAGQKLAIAKAKLKSHSAGANMRRMKSMRVRAKVGM
jgi:hypothetical protein